VGADWAAKSPNPPPPFFAETRHCDGDRGTKSPEAITVNLFFLFGKIYKIRDLQPPVMSNQPKA